ncbi:hypothetical protein CC80DRAFT_108250 [Byssothecium circinans]|uniref:Uncharacterized protein n=1 Tax=Byssothecium circinans TaxID=147558 RepID=A0A6A5TW33_9PLEO|nr:hypothetical protein CC80DRAFT_108250 [Byssothecium circinans]
MPSSHLSINSHLSTSVPSPQKARHPAACQLPKPVDTAILPFGCAHASSADACWNRVCVWYVGILCYGYCVTRMCLVAQRLVIVGKAVSILGGREIDLRLMIMAGYMGWLERAMPKNLHYLHAERPGLGGARETRMLCWTNGSIYTCGLLR